LKLRKIKGQIYKGNLGFYKNTKGILGRLVKKSLNLNPFPPIPPNFGGMKIWGLEGIGRNECSIPFPSFKLPNKGMVSFPSIPSYLNFQTGERREYS
jgi:hypothetical protein